MKRSYRQFGTKENEKPSFLRKRESGTIATGFPLEFTLMEMGAGMTKANN